MVERLPSMHKGLGSVPSIKKKEKKRKKNKKRMKRRVGFVAMKPGEWDKTVGSQRLNPN